jgi:RNA-directed DNA polymerase
VRLIQKWLRAGVLEEEKPTVSEEGTAQGGSASPLLSTFIMSLTLWAEAWRRKIARGDILMVRFADDIGQ